MPSSHSATVTAVAAAIGFQEGVGGPIFAIGLILACVVRSLSSLFSNLQITFGLTFLILIFFSTFSKSEDIISVYIESYIHLG